MGLVKFITKTAAQYAALQTKDNDALYFITDTQRIYKGSVEYCQRQQGGMVIKGNLTPGEEGAILVPGNYKRGDVWRFTADGVFDGRNVNEGDMAVAMSDYSGSSRGADFGIYREMANIHETKWE